MLTETSGIKTLEQIKQEFLNEYISKKEAAEPAPDEQENIQDIQDIQDIKDIQDIQKPETETKDTKDAEEAEDVKEVKEKKQTTEIRNNGNSRITVTRVSPVWKGLLFLLVKIVLIVLTFVLLFTFLYGIIRYNEPSMAPMIKDGDLVLFYRYTKSGYLPQDAVVLKFRGQRQVRRVVATAGDTVDITADGLVINGSLQQEPSIYQRTERYEEGVNFPLTVPEGHIFVLGDSRVGATDSRIYGCVDIEDTLGKVMAVIRRRSI